MSRCAKSPNGICTASVFAEVNLIAMPFVPNSVLAPSSDALAPRSFLLLVVRLGAPSSVLAPNSDALAPRSFLLLVVEPLVASLLLVAMPFAPRSFLLLAVSP